jgi:ribonuclease HI
MNTTTPAHAEPTARTACGAQPQVGQTRIEIFTDGSCIGNPGYGGYGFVLLRREASGKIIKTVEGSGHAVEITTNIRMELTAACAALEALGRVTGEPISILCDANLIPNAMNGWLAKWKAKDWKKSDGKLVENRDLWERLERAIEGRDVTWHWVRGHNGTEHNERADKLAYGAARKAEKIITGR